MLWGYQYDPLEMSISLSDHGGDSDVSLTSPSKAGWLYLSVEVRREESIGFGYFFPLLQQDFFFKTLD